MPKTSLREPVTRDWVHDLPFMMQAALLCAMRGPDGVRKHHSIKFLVQYLRYVVIKPCAMLPDRYAISLFMWPEIFNSGSTVHLIREEMDDLPRHFTLHLMHAFEIVGFFHPDSKTSQMCYTVYAEMCRAMHVQPETLEQCATRLNDMGEGIHGNPPKPVVAHL